jgi:hypothetical protein
MQREFGHCLAVLAVLLAVLGASGCRSRESWLTEICDRESGFEHGPGWKITSHARIPSESVMLDLHFAGNGQGPIITWMAERGFQQVEVWERAAREPLMVPVSRVERYSIGPIGEDCLPTEKIGGPQMSERLGLGVNRCVRHEVGVAPRARYLLALESNEEPPSLTDRFIGQRAVRQRFALIDREHGQVIAAINSGAISGTRGMFSPRGNSCDRGIEVQAMSQLLQAPSDRRS